MKEKKGFVFVETIIVIVVAMVLLVTIYSSFSLILTNINRKETYENINDVYKVNLILDLFDTYEISGSYVLITPDDCDSYMNDDCSEVINDLGISDIFINNSPIETIIAGEPDIQPTLINYLNSIDRENKMIVIHCIRDERDYYASLRFEERQ